MFLSTINFDEFLLDWNEVKHEFKYKSLKKSKIQIIYIYKIILRYYIIICKSRMYYYLSKIFLESKNLNKLNFGLIEWESFTKSLKSRGCNDFKVEMNEGKQKRSKQLYYLWKETRGEGESRSENDHDSLTFRRCEYRSYRFFNRFFDGCCWHRCPKKNKERRR